MKKETLISKSSKMSEVKIYFKTELEIFENLKKSNNDEFEFAKKLIDYLPLGLSFLKTFFNYSQNWEINKGEDLLYDNTRLYEEICIFRNCMEDINKAYNTKNSELLFQSVSSIRSQAMGFSHIHDNLHPECDDLVECGNLDAFGYDMCKKYSRFLRFSFRSKSS